MSANRNAEVLAESLAAPWRQCLRLRLLDLSEGVPIDKLQLLVDAAEFWDAESDPTMRLVFPKRRRGRKAATTDAK